MGEKIEIESARRGQSEIVRSEITGAMLLAGIAALGEWDQKRRDGLEVSKSDLVCGVYAAMRLAK
jgi:hypothetical protein